MRISKLWSTVCAVAFLAGFHTVRAQDNPAQAAARAALMGKFSQLNAQSSPPASQTPATATPPPVEMQFTPAPASSATLLAPAGAPDTPAQAAARAALKGKTAN